MWDLTCVEERSKATGARKVLAASYPAYAARGMPTLRTRARASVVPLLILGGGAVAACGSPPPAVPQVPAPTPSAVTPKEKPLDTSPVPEPPGLVILGRVKKPDAIVSAVGSWTHLPLP